MKSTTEFLFMDSGAHGLYNEFLVKRTHKGPDKYSWYRTKDFWKYVDEFAEYMKLNEEYVTVFANVDVIFNSEMTWEVQEYLENKHGLIPLPVIHYGTDIKWLKKYLEKDYEYIALGGLGQNTTKQQYIEWADSMFDEICNQESRLPRTKVHGFAVTAHSLMSRYPWYSVDSASWLNFASYGFCIYPATTNGKWDYTKSYLVMRVSVRPSGVNKPSVLHLRKAEEKEAFEYYVHQKGFEIGESVWEDGEERIITPGIVNDDKLRCSLNAMYFIDLVENLPQWPWPFYRDSIQKKLL
jgi:hypothetical protein